MQTELIYLVASFIFSAIVGKILIPVLRKLKVGQSERLDGPRAHLKKQGTPTMGGIAIILSVTVFTIIYCVLNYKNIDITPLLAVFLASLGYGLVGFIDDYKKVVLKNTEGLNPTLKMIGLGIISVIYTIFLMKYLGLQSVTIIPFVHFELALPTWIFIPFILFVMLGSTNAVNLTDGVDGLAGSVGTIMMLALSIISYKLGYKEISLYSLIVMGSIMGFLIYNFYKAKIIMGDVGSLFLGGVISSIAIYMKYPLILVIVAIIPVIETLSVIAQVLYFRKTGKRLLRMSPLHHHFELSGWRENKVVAVFSLVTLIASIVGILAV